MPADLPAGLAEISRGQRLSTDPHRRGWTYRHGKGALMGGSSQQPVTQQTTQTKDPWAPAQPFLQSAMQNAFNNYNAGVGYIPYMAATQAQLDPWQQTGLSSMAGQALIQMGGTPGLNAASDLATNMIKQQGISDPLANVANR